ncbi:hypothetical protein LguiB_018953 [Lonicera macranthoides]
MEKFCQKNKPGSNILVAQLTNIPHLTLNPPTHTLNMEMDVENFSFLVILNSRKTSN